MMEIRTTGAFTATLILSWPARVPSLVALHYGFDFHYLTALAVQDRYLPAKEFGESGGIFHSVNK